MHKLSCALRNGWLVCFLMAPFYLRLNKLLEWKLRLTQAQCLWSEKLKCISRGLVFTNKINIHIIQTGINVTHHCCSLGGSQPKGLVRQIHFPWKDWLTHTAYLSPEMGEPWCRSCWKSKSLTGCWACCNSSSDSHGCLTHAL